MLKLQRDLICTLFLAGAFVAQSFAQGGATGAITGTVQDTSGASIANAQVRITNQATRTLERTVQTGPDGSFTAPLLPVGSYSLDISSAGFAPRQFSDIAVRITETTRVIAKLGLQAVRANVEVQAEVQEVDTTDATTGQAIDHGTINTLPLATQNFQQLLTLSSGAQGELNAASQLGRGNVRMEVNGQREDNNNYQIEGISATDYNVAELTTTPLPNPATIQEFRVQTSLYDASQGRNGGGDINAILKTGTNTFHGEAYEFFRNTVLDANEYFLNQAGEARPVIKQNIFGGDVGGPIGSNGKLGFFFVNYSGTRQRSGDSPERLSALSFLIFPRQIAGLRARPRWNRHLASLPLIRLQHRWSPLRAISLARQVMAISIRCRTYPPGRLLVRSYPLRSANQAPIPMTNSQLRGIASSEIHRTNFRLPSSFKIFSRMCPSVREG